MHPSLSVAVLLGVSSAGRAQETCAEQLKFPEVGRWAEYQAVIQQEGPVHHSLCRSRARETRRAKD